MFSGGRAFAKKYFFYLVCLFFSFTLDATLTGCGENSNIGGKNRRLLIEEREAEPDGADRSTGGKATTSHGPFDFERINCSENVHLFSGNRGQAEAVDRSGNSGCGKVGSRFFVFDLPLHYDPERSLPYPVFYIWHGCESSAGGFRDAVNVTATSAEPVISVFPDSDEDNNCWNAWKDKSKDIEFFDALHLSVSRSFNIDKSRIFSVGFSSGAYMAHYLGCLRNSIIHGLVAVAGAVPETDLTDSCTSPMPAFIAHGSEDTAVEYLPGFDKTLKHYGEINRCENSASAFGSRTPSGLAAAGVTFVCRTQTCDTTLRYCLAACSKGAGKCLRERPDNPSANMAAHDLNTWIWFIEWSVKDLLANS